MNNIIMGIIIIIMIVVDCWVLSDERWLMNKIVIVIVIVIVALAIAIAIVLK